MPNGIVIGKRKTTAPQNQGNVQTQTQNQRPAANIPNQAMIAVIQQMRQQQRQPAENQATPMNLSPELFLNRIINNGREAPPQIRPRLGNVVEDDALGTFREEQRNRADAETLSRLNAAGTRQNFRDMPSSNSLGNDALYANLKSVLADIERIRGGDYPEHIKNRMLGNAYDTAAQTAGVLDLGGIEDTAQAELVRYIHEQASENAATAKKTLNPVQLHGHQRKGAASGGLNAVGIYNVPGATDSQGNGNEKKFFKQEAIVDRNYRNLEANGDHLGEREAELRHLLPHLGINAGKGDEKVDRHMRDREIAYSLLNDYLGAGVSVGARESQDENGNQGALLDEAKGMTANEYGWSYLAPLDPTTAPLAEHDKAIDLADSSFKNELNQVIDKEKINGTYGKRLKAAGKELVPASYQVARKGKNKQNLTDNEGKTIYAPTLDIADPKFHRDMNRMQIMDSLTGHIDRHGNNFKIETDEEAKYKSLKAIDNDMSFGRNPHAFGERYHNNPGMGDGALIDKRLANRVKATPKQDLNYLFKGMFSDDLTESEAVIDNLWNNMQGFNEYAERNKKFQVEDWTKTHAVEDLLSATGALPNAETKSSHNTLYQRLMLTRLAQDPRVKGFFKGAIANEQGY